VTPAPAPNGDPVPVAIASPHGRGPAILIVLLVAVVAAGAFGRLVPSAGPATEPGTSPRASVSAPEPAVRLVSPIADVLHLRSTEVLVRGVAEPGIRGIDVSVDVAGQPIGGANLNVGVGRRFSGLVRITPPAHRTIAVLEIREVGGTELLAEVSFPVDAGALLLPKDPSGLRGRAGGVLIVDVLVYGRLRELRGLLTGVDGDLIATGSTVLSGVHFARGGSPRTVAIELEIPIGALPSRARLHLLGIDPAGIEVEHIDANVLLSGD
jgi:hypothetical protein